MRLTLKQGVVLTSTVAVALIGLSPNIAKAANEASIQNVPIVAGVPDFVTVCKTTGPVNPASGTFTFTLDEVTPTNPPTATRTVNVPVGSCSAAIPVAAQPVRISEQPRSNSSLAAVTIAGSGTLDSTDLANRTVVVSARPGASVVTFRNQGSSTTTSVCGPAAPPPLGSTAPFVLDLKAGSPGTFGPLPSWVKFTTPLTPLPAGTPDQGWDRGAIRIDMTGYCKANIVLEYEGSPSGWTVDIGDSPTNDGYGGDAGSTVNCAEVQIVNNVMTAYSKGLAPGVAPAIGTRTFDLKDGSVKYVVSNGTLTSGQPFSSIVDSNLFSIPDSTGADSSFIYAAFNSVITQRGDRVGHGLRRVMITLA